LKICLVNSYYYPWIGGAETYARNLAENLVKRGHEVTVYCSERPIESGESSINGVRVVRMRTPAAFYGTPLALFPSKIIADKYDVIHSNFPSPYLAAASACLARLKSTPATLTWHNDLPPVTSSVAFIVKLHDLISGSYLSTYKKIIATTKIYSRNSETLRRYQNKVVVIQNGVDTKRFNPKVNGTPIREKFGLGGSKVMLFVGVFTRWHAYKGLDVLLEAFKIARQDINSTKLLIVGGGEMIEHYKSIARDLRLSNDVVFAGRVEDDELPPYYAACDFAILPSRDSSEGFGLVLLEAMACGKPVIGSRVGGIPEIISDGENGFLVRPNNAKELATAISSMLDEDTRRRLASNARKFAESRDWEIVAIKVENLYLSILTH
jgi:glycosyltransferase involved in cell wall biosynthesis